MSSKEKEKTLTEEMIREFTDYTTQRHQATRLPREAYLYFPRDKDLIDFETKNLSKLTRKVFEGGVEYICFEKAKLEELEYEIEKYNKKKNTNKKLILPSRWTDANSLRFLQAMGFDVKKTVEIIQNHLEWRLVNLPVNITNKVMEILNIGYLYVHGRDHRFRPIININASIVSQNTKKFNFEDWNSATIYFMEYVIENLLLPGQIENWVIICDLKDVSVMSLPNDFKKILTMLQNNYRCRLFRMFIVNVGSFFNMIWGVIKKIIDSNTEKKIKILKAGNTLEIYEIINRSQTERKYCGVAHDVESYFFPPIFPSDKYITDFEDEVGLLVSEEEYSKIIEQNPKLTVSPYVNFHKKEEEIKSGQAVDERDNQAKASENDDVNKKLDNKETLVNGFDSNSEVNQNEDFIVYKKKSTEVFKLKTFFPRNTLDVIEELSESHGTSEKIMFDKEKRSLANKINNNTNNPHLVRNSSMLEQESQSRLIEINNITMNSNINSNRKGSENHLNNRYANLNTSKNGSETNKHGDISTITFAKQNNNFSNIRNFDNAENENKNETVISLGKMGLNAISNETNIDSVRRRKAKKASNSIAVLKIDKSRHKTPEFIKRSENNQPIVINRENESYFDFTSKNEIDIFNSEETTNKSVLLNGKVKIIKNNSSKSKQTKDEKKEINPNIEVKRNLSEICCSNKVNDNCLVF